MRSKGKSQKSGPNLDSPDGKGARIPMALPLNLRDKPALRSAHEIVARLLDAGHLAYFVGGFVRALALESKWGPGVRGGFGDSVPDIDIATNATPEDISAIFGGTHFVGRAFGVSLVEHLGFRFEVTTFRKEGPYSDKRRPDYVVVGSFHDDSSRRDFTVNSLYWDPLQELVIDWHGGLTDLETKRIRTVGHPQNRFEEDCLRILRMCRFAAVLDFSIDEGTWQAAMNEVPHLKALSRERVLIEIEKTPMESMHLLLEYFHKLKVDHALWNSNFELSYLRNIMKVSAIDQGQNSVHSKLSSMPMTLIGIASWEELIESSTSVRNMKLKDLNNWPSQNNDRKMVTLLITILQHLSDDSWEKEFSDGFYFPLLNGLCLLSMFEKIAVLRPLGLAQLFERMLPHSNTAKNFRIKTLLNMIDSIPPSMQFYSLDQAIQEIDDLEQTGVRESNQVADCLSRQDIIEGVKDREIQPSVTRLLLDSRRIFNLTAPPPDMLSEAREVMALINQSADRLVSIAEKYNKMLNHMRRLCLHESEPH